MTTCGHERQSSFSTTSTEDVPRMPRLSAGLGPNCRESLQEWVKVCDQAVPCGVKVCAFAKTISRGRAKRLAGLFQKLWQVHP
jgi:hypothetical protein